MLWRDREDFAVRAGTQPVRVAEAGRRLGDEGATAYARAMGIKPGEFLARFGVPMPPREFGEKIVSVLDDPKYAEGFAFGLKGDTGVTMLEGAAA